MIPPCLTLNNIRFISRVKWSNPGKEVAPSPTPWCSSYWKWSLLVTLNYGCQLTTGLISFSSTGCHTKVKEPNLPFCLPNRIHTLPKGISAIWNANSLVQDLNSDRQVPFLGPQSLCHNIYKYIYSPFGRNLNMLTVSLTEGENCSKRGVLGITLKCIWWWGFSSGDLGSVEYPFIAITPRSTQILNGSTC